VTDRFHKLRPKADSEKITINLGFIDLGHIDLLVREGFYANRSDLIRTAVRNQIERHAAETRRSQERSELDLGIRHITRQQLEAARSSGELLDINVLGLAAIDSDVSADLARSAIRSVTVLGAFHASTEVKAALADRIR
jgi:Arc/MetJ-type ribon-helix-helix transcriptional regulator